MKHIHYLDKEAQQVEEAGAHGVRIRTVIGDTEGAPNFHMRVLTFDKDGKSPDHSHSWEHEVFVLSGSGRVTVDGKRADLKPGDVVYVPPNAHHNFEAKEKMEII